MGSFANEGVTNGGSTNGAHTGTDGTAVEGLLTRLITRLDRLEAKLDRLELAVSQAPGALAMFTDTIDGLYQDAARAGIDTDERLKLGLQLLERMTEPRTIHALKGLLDHVETVESAARQAPGMVAMVMDLFDEIFVEFARQGIDPELAVRKGLIALRDLLTISELPEMKALRESGVFDPQTLVVMGHAAHALVQSQGVSRPAGVGSLLTAPFRRDVQEALGFGLTFAAHFGERLKTQGTKV